MRYYAGMMNTALLSQVNDLPPVERLAFVGAVWDSLVLEDLPVSVTEKCLLDSRLQAVKDSPEDQSTWRAVQARLDAKLL